ncbi:hypothetical protein AGMMS50212_09310 [Spirochaetia bacterium]|nr:hypothetical protein AGMMS50212_09310 [Spirochaetia bacterium]
MMWKKIQSVIAVFCLIVYSGAAGFAAYRIFTGIQKQQYAADKEFKELTDFASRAGVLGFYDKKFKDEIKNYLENSKALEAVIVQSPQGVVFAIEKTNIINFDGEFPVFNNQNRLYREPFNSDLKIEGYNGVSISAISPFINYNRLLYILRTSLLAILFAVVIAFITFILDIILIKEGNSAKIQDDDDYTDFVPNEPPPEFVDEPAAPTQTESEGGNESFAENTNDFDIDFGESEPFTENTNDFDIDFGESEPLPEPVDETSGDSSTEPLTQPAEPPPYEQQPAPAENVSTPLADAVVDGLDESLLIDDEQPPPDIPSIPEPLENDESPLENEVEKKPDKKGGLLAAAVKIAESGNFGKNDAPFSSILEKELESAKSENKDLIFIRAEWTAPELQYQPLIEKAAKFFKRGTRIFENDDEGIQIIIPGMDMDQGYNLAKEFHLEVLSSLDADPDADTGLLIGLSWRSNRDIDAERLIEETEHALDEARGDKSRPIVAYQVGTEK